MNRRYGILLLAVAVLMLGWAHGAGAQAKPSGELVWALHVSISPSWFDPGENGGLITPFTVLYAMHDGVGGDRLRRVVEGGRCVPRSPHPS